MARLMTLILLLATVSCSFGLKKDKFKIKAKGFGLKNLQAVPMAAAAPAPYYPAAAPAAPAPYYPPMAAPAAPAPAYPAAAPSAGYGFNGGFNGGASAATSASFTASGSPVAPHVVPVIIPIALMTQPQASSAPLVNQPSFSSLSSLSSGFGLGSQLGATQMNYPRVDLEYVPVSDMGSATYGFSALNGNSFDSFNSADQFDSFGSDGFASGSYNG